MLNKHASGVLLCRGLRDETHGLGAVTDLDLSCVWLLQGESERRVSATTTCMRRERRVDVSTVRDADCYVAVCDCCDSVETLLSLTCVCQHVGGSYTPMSAGVVPW